MRRVRVFGNSHVLAWREGWAQVAAQWPDVAMTFFALPDKVHSRYLLRGSLDFAPRRTVTPEERARAVAINGCEAVTLAGHDLAVWVGLPWQPEAALALAQAGDPYPLAGARPALGPGFVAAALDEAADAVLAAWKAETIPAGPPRPVLFGRPVYAVTCRGSGHALYAPWRDTQAHGAAAMALLAAHRDRLSARAAALGLDFAVQPFDTLDDAGATQADWLAEGGGMVDPADSAARGDHSHMNAGFGARCIAAVLGRAGFGAGA